MLVDIIITGDAMDVLMLLAPPEYRNKSGCDKLPDGTWLVAVKSETAERIRAAVLPGETLSDAVVRCALAATLEEPN